uniref:Secreted protein n=1 Tax=Parascaris univalens TaxID=6257 RepID=A0A914ZJ50_PARUN
TILERLGGTSAEGQAISRSRTRQRPSSESSASHTKEQTLDDPKEHEIKRNVGIKSEEKIAQGNVRRRTDYPTMDDVASDWGTEDDEREQDKKKQTNDEKGKTPKKCH